MVAHKIPSRAAWIQASLGHVNNFAACCRNRYRFQPACEAVCAWPAKMTNNMPWPQVAFTLFAVLLARNLFQQPVDKRRG